MPLEGATGRQPAGALVGVLTNRWNLIEFLSRRVVTPLGTFDKYYDDLLRHTPGRVPLVATPLSPELVADVTGDEPEMDFPVFLEVAGAKPGTVPFVTLEEVVQVHFRSQRDLDEHAARRFDNVPPGPPLTITSAIWDGGKGTIDELVSAPAAGAAVDVGILRRAERYAGGVTVLATCDQGGSASASAVARLMDGRAWAGAALPWLATAAPFVISGSVDTGSNADEALLSAVLGTLTDAPARAHSLNLLSGVEEVLAGSRWDAALEPSLRKIRRVVDSEDEFTPLTERGFTVAKALLLFLLRRDPESLLAWPTEETGADSPTFSTAAFLAGFSVGRRQLPVTLRANPLDLALASVEMHVAVSGGFTGVPPAEVVADPVAGSIQVRSRGEVLVGFGLVTLADLVRRADLDDPEISGACADLARRLRCDDLFTTVVSVKAGMRLEPKGLSIHIPGIAETRLLIDRDRFVDRLREADAESSPQAARLRTVISGERPAPKRRATRKT